MWIYPLTAEFRAELTAIGHGWRSGDNQHARAPHASLATALRAVTGQPVRILPRARWNDGEVFIATPQRFDLPVLGMAVRAWEQLARRGNDSNILAPLLASVTPVCAPLAEAVRNPSPGRVDADRWVYEVLGWLVAQRLCAAPVAFDHIRVPFRIDTDGALVAWDNPITKPSHNGAPVRALIKITPHIKTLAGTNDLVCILEASVTRLVSDLYHVRSVWIDHGRHFGGSALLRLPIAPFRDSTGSWRTGFRDYSPGVVAACGLSPLPWGEDVLTACPSTVRGWRAVNQEHPIGTGVGPRTYRCLVEHAKNTLGADPVVYAPSATRVLREPRGERLAPESLDAAIAAAGPISGPAYRQLRIVHLSASPAARQRVRAELANYQSDDAARLTADLGVMQKISHRAGFAVYDIADLLAHGCTDRSELLDRAPLLKAEDGALVVALVETEYAHGMKIADDAKPQLRRSLAELGVTTQFLATPPKTDDEDHHRPLRPATARGRNPAHRAADRVADDRDYPAESALKDLVRVAGLTDDRLRAAVTMGTVPLTRGTWLVGIHARRQNNPSGSKGNGIRPALVTVLTAVHAHAEPDRPWTFHMYAPGHGWSGLAAGTARFHAGQIGTTIGDRDNNEQTAYKAIRELTDQALAELGTETPIIVFADAAATRRIWRGFTDAHLGSGSLPGDTLPDAEKIAVVRVSAEDDAVPRPVHRTDGQQARSGDLGQPATPGNRLYVRETGNATRTWLLGRTSRTYGADQAGRCGARFTRFTLPDTKQRLQGKPWHSFTGTEFAVVRPGVLTEQELVAVGARLCAQPMTWDGQTRWPVPLHLAHTADRTHPGWRAEDPVSEL